MRLSDYIKDKIMTYLLHLLCMILLTFFFYITGYNKNAVLSSAECYLGS